MAVSLICWFNREEGEINILFKLSNRKGTIDLRIIQWIEMLSAVLVQERKSKELGTAFCDEQCYVFVTIFSQCGATTFSDIYSY